MRPWCFLSACPANGSHSSTYWLGTVLWHPSSLLSICPSWDGPCCAQPGRRAWAMHSWPGAWPRHRSGMCAYRRSALCSPSPCWPAQFLRRRSALAASLKNAEHGSSRAWLSLLAVAARMQMAELGLIPGIGIDREANLVPAMDFLELTDARVRTVCSDLCVNGYLGYRRYPSSKCSLTAGFHLVYLRVPCGLQPHVCPWPFRGPGPPPWPGRSCPVHAREPRPAAHVRGPPHKTRRVAHRVLQSGELGLDELPRSGAEICAAHSFQFLDVEYGLSPAGLDTEHWPQFLREIERALQNDPEGLLVTEFLTRLLREHRAKIRPSQWEDLVALARRHPRATGLSLW